MKVLIVGASGLVGTAAANAFVAAGHRVVGISRRFPDLIEAPIEHIPLDLQDASACAAFAAQQQGITHVVYTAVFEMPGLMSGWSDPHQIEVNGKMLRNVLQPLLQSNPVEHITLLQGTKAYGAAVQPMRVPGREQQARVEHPNFYWVQEDYLQEQCAAHGISWTIFRPQLIVGPNHGVVMNLPPIIGAYAALRRTEGLPFSFPGGADWIWEAADARLVGDACLWTAENPGTQGEIYNLTNGEVFSWRDMWPALARTLGVELGADEPLDLAAYMQERSTLWQQVVKQHGLQHTTLPQLLGESHHYANLCFNYGSERSPAPTFLSTVKVKQAGFVDTYNTEASFCHWLDDLQARKIIPDRTAWT